MDLQQSSSFNLLNTKIQQWVWKQGWHSLKEIQENAIPPILDGNYDVIISAATAGGKTEAVFLPVLTNLVINVDKIIRPAYQSIAPERDYIPFKDRV